MIDGNHSMCGSWRSSSRHKSRDLQQNCVD